MTPQFVDFNADGYNDMIMATFEGHVFLIKGSKNGYGKPVAITDKNGDNIRIAMYWDDEANDYKSVNRSVDGESYDESHHMTSTVAVDWDQDDDLDLVLGAYEGALYWCENEGTATVPNFSDKNRQIKAAGKHMTLKDGLATPVIADFNQDGRFDIVCGGSKGGVYLFENTGTASSPKFAASKTLIAKTIKPSRSDSESTDDYFSSMSVPVKNGLPTCPGTSFHIDVVDYDLDGKLDLIVGGQSYLKEQAKKLTAEEQDELKKLKQRMAEVEKQMETLYADKSDEELTKLFESEEAQAIQNEMMPLWERMSELSPQPRAKEFVWFYRNKGQPKTDAPASQSIAKSKTETSSSTTGNGKLSMTASIAPVDDSNGSKVTLNLKLIIPAGFHIYGSKDTTSPSKITITDLGGLQGGSEIPVPVGRINMTKGAAQYWLEGNVSIDQTLTVPEGFDGGTLKGKLDYMICDDKMCLPPDSIEFSVNFK